MRLTICLGIIVGALLSAAFATVTNFVAGAQLIGYSFLSAIVIGAIFGAVGSFVVGVASALTGKTSVLFYLIAGAIFGAVMYLVNVYAGWNAGFSLFGLGLISAFGLMSGIGLSVAQRVLKPFENLQRLT